MSYKQYLERRLRELGSVSSQTCGLRPDVPLADCYGEGSFKEIGDERMELGIERRLAQCRYCHMIYPTDVFEGETDG